VSDDCGNSNGNGAAHTPHVAEVRITMELCTHTVRVDAATPNLDCALSMLAAATRALEAQLRQQQALAFAQQQQRAAENRALAQSITQRR
jgi:hypothetical protein